jgi:hypothetical protein
MPNTKTIFEQINDFAQDVSENFLIEHAMQINPSVKTVTAGVQFEANEFHAPLFLSSGELRNLADEAERLTTEYLNKQS